MVKRFFLIIKTYVAFLFIATLYATSMQANNNLLFDELSSEELPLNYRKKNPRDWTFIVYIAADNDLRSFAARNIKQMAQIGSNNHINIVVQVDIRITGNKKMTRRYFIEQNKIYHTNNDDQESQTMDSGDPKTLISCANWAVQNYPANKYALILWNHGTGIIDPERGKIINPSELFMFNPSINKLELDRTIGFLDFINKIKVRGICWDDSTGNYLTNQKLEYALKQITETTLQGKKINVLGFDACLMSMVEVANVVKKYVNVMVGSQEVELGTGWDYSRVLAPFAHGSLQETQLAQHIVNVYEETYNKVTNDYTQSAVTLSAIDPLEENINAIAVNLLECLKRQKSNSVKSAIHTSRHKQLCTHFDEPSYIDLHHFYSNLLSNIKSFVFVNQAEAKPYKDALIELLEEGKSLIHAAVFANTVGKNLNLARGISIYFPEHRIHPSYRHTNFATSNKWASFLAQYLLA